VKDCLDTLLFEIHAGEPATASKGVDSLVFMVLNSDSCEVQAKVLNVATTPGPVGNALYNFAERIQALVTMQAVVDMQL
jgi:hypothetical protein